MWLFQILPWKNIIKSEIYNGLEAVWLETTYATTAKCINSYI